MKKVHKDHAARQEAYRERQKEKREEAAEVALEKERARKRDLRFFGESAYGQIATTADAEIQIHKMMLRVLGEEPDIQSETLRQLAYRCWTALLNSKNIGVYSDCEGAVWIPMFDVHLQKFDCWHGHTLKSGAAPDYFDAHWVPPKDCTGNEEISLDDLPSLPPTKKRHVDL
jgi:hypothetical protein